MDVTIIIPISRPYFLKELAESLESLECDVNNTGLFVYVDGDLHLLEKAKRLVAQSKFSRKDCVYRNRGIPSVGSVRGRRKRIADIHNEIKTKIPESEYVFLIEDDTIVPANALQKLLDCFNTFPAISFASGIELGRWGFPIIGGWIKDGDKILSVPLEKNFRGVDASGFYCMVTRYEIYKNHTFKPFEQILGPDVDFGFSQKTMGVLDYSIRCSHKTQKEPLTFDKINPVQILFTRDESSKFGWRQEVL